MTKAQQDELRGRELYEGVRFIVKHQHELNYSLLVVHKDAVEKLKEKPEFKRGRMEIIDKFSDAVELLPNAKNEAEMYGVFKYANRLLLKNKSA